MPAHGAAAAHRPERDHPAVGATPELAREARRHENGG